MEENNMDEQTEQRNESIPEDLVQNMLKNVADITKQTQENEAYKHEIAGQLRNIGYDYFPEEEINPEHVIKILKVAINNTMTTKLDLEQEEADDHDDNDDDDNDDDESDKIVETLGKKLEGLLEMNDGKCLDDYFSKGCYALMFWGRAPGDGCLF